MKKSVSKKASVGREIIQGLTEFRDALHAKKKIPEHFTMRRVHLTLEPRAVTPDQVQELRQAFHASQPVFAMLIGISAATLKNWEQGVSMPPAWGRRLLEMMKADPEPWLKKLRDGVRETARP